MASSKSGYSHRRSKFSVKRSSRRPKFSYARTKRSMANIGSIARNLRAYQKKKYEQRKSDDALKAVMRRPRGNLRSIPFTFNPTRSH